MNRILNAIEAWVASKGGWSHLCAAAYLGALAAYAQVPAFTHMVDQAYHAMPQDVHEAILAALGLIAWYRNNDAK